MPLIALGAASVLAAGCSPESGLLGALPAERQVPPQLRPADQAYRGGPMGGSSHYPLAKAPWKWVNRQKLLPDDGAADDRFGVSVSLSGDTALVGAFHDDDSGSGSGSAYVFVRRAAGWAQEGKLVPDDGAADDWFGVSVSLSGDTALVGADGGGASGSAYVFVRRATGWTQEGKLLADDGAPGDYFGVSVSLSGDTALVGAFHDDDLGSNSGSAYVFARSAADWAQEDKLVPDDGAVSDSFGYSVSLSGDRALVGAYHNDDFGSAYVFARSATGWAQEDKLLADDGAPGDWFGVGVSLSGDTALAGAQRDGDSGAYSGSAYVFARSATGWAQEGKLLANDGAEDDSFGTSVSLSGDRALVGAFHDDDSGSAYVFARSATGWTQEDKLLADDGAPGDYFGGSVSLSGDKALVGAYRDGDSGSNSGSAYIHALRLGVGQPCASDGACADEFCVDGVCCERACDGACEACDAAGLEGACTPLSLGSPPSPGCEAYVCNGAAGSCPDECAGDSDCAAAYHCQSALACLPKEAAGQACASDSVCLSGHCVDGVCCEAACDQGCGSCVVSGFEGVCSPLGAQHAGTPTCTPYLCTGSVTSCPDRCAKHGDCANGHHCAQEKCQPNDAQGAACTESDACASGHCTDGLCCVAGDCGAYRCGSAGACLEACSSSAQCATGHQCSSAGKCAPRAASAAGTNDSGSCQLTGAGLATQSPLSWFGACAWLAGLNFLRRRRRSFRSGAASR